MLIASYVALFFAAALLGWLLHALRNDQRRRK